MSQHQWAPVTQPGTVNGPAEHFDVCQSCGMEKPGSDIDIPECEYEEPDCDCGEDECPQCGRSCTECRGEGSGVLGCDFDNMDPLWDGPDGTLITCPNCHGSGLAKDMTYW